MFFDATHFEQSMKHHFREVEYLRQQLKDAEGVIAQLHRGFPIPGEPVYIHPADLAEVFDKLAKTSLVDVVRGGTVQSGGNECIVGGIHYRQTTQMPKHTKKFE